ncbi:MAG TPA: carboxylating nicotinate-nucleotide diphosphorylase [Bauldia sp.]|nr:carboxylating nicotinate-nucleotide diphosphorylase [Bauldia sp.]
MVPVLDRRQVAEAVRAALAEDLSAAGDITSAATIPAEATAVADFGVRKAGVVAGLPIAEATFRSLDPGVKFEVLHTDGSRVAPGTVVARVAGNARAVLSGERVALNYLSHLSGIATAAAALVEQTKGTRAVILDTRKTTPGMRAFEKYAVACGGATNHRLGLYDAVLIKDNHIAVAGGAAEAIRRARSHAPGVKIEIEVGSLAELDEAMGERPDIVMLDNMRVADMAEAVRRVAGRAKIEASGNVTVETVAAIAATGVDYISSGWITHSAPALDIGLDIEISRSPAPVAAR